VGSRKIGKKGNVWMCRRILGHFFRKCKCYLDDDFTWVNLRPVRYNSLFSILIDGQSSCRYVFFFRKSRYVQNNKKGLLVTELLNAFAKIRQLNERNTEQPCAALHKSHKAIQNLPHMFVHANPVLVAPHTWISWIDVKMFCCRWPDVFQRSYWYGVFPVEVGKIGETM
jgi:hypothetical protein